MALFAVLMCANFASCNNDENNTSQDSDKIVVSFGFSGEIEISESPLSRTSTDDLFLIHAYFNDANSSYNHYATGLFDNVEDIKIKLQKDYTYQFQAFIIKDGKTKLQQPNNNEYTYPFPYCILTNKFEYPGQGDFNPIYTGFVLADGNCYRIPNLDVYIYSEDVTYAPGEDEGEITIPMRRWAFGVEFIGDGFEDETLTINLESLDAKDGYDYYSPIITLNKSNTSFDDIYFFPAMLGEDFNPINLHVAFYLDGELIARPEITFQRNKKTTVKIDLSKQGNAFGFNYETSEMGDGGTYNVVGDNATQE